MQAATVIGMPVRDLVSRVRTSAPTMLDPAWMRETWSGTYGTAGLTSTVDQATSFLRLGDGWLAGRGSVSGTIRQGDNHAGSLVRELEIDRSGVATVRHEHMRLGNSHHRTRFGTEFNASARQRYELAGVQEITTKAGVPAGSFVWARRGFELAVDGATEAERMSKRAIEIARLVDNARRRLTPDEFASVAARLSRTGDVRSDTLTSVQELARLPLGERILMDQTWDGRAVLQPAGAWFGDAASPADLSRTLRAYLPDALDPARFRASVEAGNDPNGVRLVGDRAESNAIVRLADEDAGAIRAEHSFDVQGADGRQLGSATARIGFGDDGGLTSHVWVRDVADDSLVAAIKDRFSVAAAGAD